MPMIRFQRPCSGFTAADLASLQAAWPDASHESDDAGDRFVVRRPEEAAPWLAILRRREGTYVSLDLSGRIFAEGTCLQALGLDGCGDGVAARAAIDDAVRGEGRSGR